MASSAIDRSFENVTDISLQTNVVESRSTNVFSEEETTFDNEQALMMQMSSTVIVVLRTSFVTLNAILIMIANAFCIYVVKISRDMSIASKIFTIALAITDFISGVRVAVNMIVPSVLDYWPYGTAYCQIEADLNVLLSALSISYLILLGVDRLVAIIKGLRYGITMTKRRALVAATVVFIFNAALYFPLPQDWRPDSPIPYPEPVFLNNVAVCEHIYTHVRPEHLLIFLSISVLIPELIALCIYVTLLIMSVKQKSKIRAQYSINQQDSLTGSIWMFSFAMLGAGIAVVPYMSVMIYESIAQQRPAGWIKFCVKWFFTSNSWWNVVIYANSNRLWRKDAVKVLRQLKCRISSKFFNKQ